MKQLLLFLAFMTIHTVIFAQPPYSGTIFIDPDIITLRDSSIIDSTIYRSLEEVVMFDRRANDSMGDWVTVNAYLFDVYWSDGLTTVAQVNEEFGSLDSATVQAEKYAFLVGQLPHVLRLDVDELWIHKGVQPFGGGNRSLLIHTGQTALYEADGILEETLVHEACHTSLDSAHAMSPGWIEAQTLDGEFISTYARDNPMTEDIAESFLVWLAVRFRADSISEEDFNTIVSTIPNRLNYFDTLNFDLFPFENSFLPVELSQFYVTYNENEHTSEIFWETASEINNEKFIVETSQDGINFKKLTEVSGLGTTQVGQEYEVIHQLNLQDAGFIYYRLKQVDFDGSYDYSSVASIHVDQKLQSAIYPTLLTPGVEITIQDPAGVQFELFDSMGRLISESINQDFTTIQYINTSSLAAGIYWVKTKSATEMIVIQNQ